MKIIEAAKRSMLWPLALWLVVPALAQPKKAPAAPRFVVDGASGYLLGASQNGRWLNAKTARKLVRGGEKYTFYDGTRVVGNAVGGKAATDGAPCEDTYFVKLTGAARVLAVSGPPLKSPRPVASLANSSAIYRAEVAKWLTAHGVKNPQVGIVKIWRADLDGDGTAEVLISAMRQQGKSAPFESISPDAAAGDYSLLLLRRVGKKGVQTVPIVSEIYPKTKKFNAPSVHELVSVLDINGDGKMEIVMRGRYYEGDSMGVYEYRGGAVKNVLESGCGA